MLIFEAAKRILNWDAATLDRFGVLVSCGIGLALAVPVALVGGASLTPEAIFAAVLNGLFAGLFAVGIYKGAQASPLPIG
jgi:hypothetical protein